MGSRCSVITRPQVGHCLAMEESWCWQSGQSTRLLTLPSYEICGKDEPAKSSCQAVQYTSSRIARRLRRLTSRYDLSDRVTPTWVRNIHIHGFFRHHCCPNGLETRETLVSCAFSCLWGWSQSNTDMAWNVFFISLQVMWAGIFGIGLAVPSNAKLQQMRNSVPPYVHSAPKPLDPPARPPAWGR